MSILQGRVSSATTARPRSATALAAFRLGFGLASWAAPRHVWQPAGVDPSRNPHAPLVARLFSSRELMIGAGLALGANAADRRRWLALGVLVDSTDAVAVCLAHRRRELGTAYTLFDGAGALLAAGLGAAALRRDGLSDDCSRAEEVEVEPVD